MSTVDLSFEFFPPKTAEGREKLYQTASTLAEFKPGYFSVTFGAGGSTQQGTRDTVLSLQQATGVNSTPHISCIGSTKENISAMLQDYIDNDVNRLVVLRGDRTSGMGPSVGELRFANELVKFIRAETGDHFEIAVAVYPEYHPESTNPTMDLTYFKAKVDAGANSAITQYFYNPDSYFYLLDSLDKAGIEIPIYPGIMPIANYTQLARFSKQCGSEIPRWLDRRLAEFGDDLAGLRQFGHDVVTELCNKLIDGGAPGLHFYTLNRAEAVTSIIQDLDN